LTARKNQKIAKIVEKYGDLIFDLCESMLGNSALAQLAFRSIIKKIRLELNRSSYEAYERSWVLKLASQELLALVRRRGEVVEPKRQFEIDSHAENQNQTQKLDFYFRRLRMLLVNCKRINNMSREVKKTMGVNNNCCVSFGGSGYRFSADKIKPLVWLLSNALIRLSGKNC